jgi:disulfide bond formation protein DsbB
MESLALAVAIIVSPAMFGGPIALLVTLWNPTNMSRFRKIFVYTLASLSLIVGLFLIFENVSPGARNVGILGIVTGIFAIWRVRKFASSNSSSN